MLLFRAATVCHPIDVVRIQMQLYEFAGSFDATRQIVRRGGVGSLYQGCVFTECSCAPEQTTVCEITTGDFVKKLRDCLGLFLLLWLILGPQLPTCGQHVRRISAAYLRQWTYGSCRMGLYSWGLDYFTEEANAIGTQVKSVRRLRGGTRLRCAPFT